MDNSSINILVIKPSSLGDVLHAFPAVTLLKKHFPNAVIDWLVNPEFSKIIEFHKDVDTVIPFPRKDLGKIATLPKAALKLHRELRKKRYDMVIDLQGLFRSSLAARLTNSKTIYGFANPKEKAASYLYDKKISIGESAEHAIEKNIALINTILSTNYSIPLKTVQKIESYSISLTSKLRESGITAKDYCIGIVAGARWESKKWPASFFADTINKASKKNKNAKFIIIGSPADKEAAEEILSKVQGTASISLAGKTSIGELVELIRRCNVVLTNDSGPMHIAAALNVKTIALFGPTDPDKTGPYGKDNTVIAAENLECLKCLKRICPLGTNICHNEISTDTVSSLITEK